MLWHWIVLAAQVTFGIFIVLNLGAWPNYVREAAENVLKNNFHPASQYVGSVVQAAWLYGGGGWLIYNFDIGLVLFILFSVFHLTASYVGVRAAQDIQRIARQ